MSEAIDWQAIFFDPDARLAERLTALARRRFGDSADAESAYNFALETISANDWQRLRDGYAGRGSPLGFLRTSFVRLLEDYAIGKYGKKRPPLWLKRLGPVWKRIYELLCLKRMPGETIVDHICAHDQESPEVVRAAMVTIKARIPGCGEYLGEYAEDTGVAQTTLQSDRAAPAKELEQADLSALFGVISGLLTQTRSLADAGQHNELASQLHGRLSALRADLAIAAGDTLLLKLVYQQNFSIARAARALKEPEHTVRRRHKAVLSAIHEVLRRHGVDADALRAGVSNENIA